MEFGLPGILALVCGIMLIVGLLGTKTGGVAASIATGAASGAAASAERVPEDIFKALFRSMTIKGAVKSTTTIRQDQFIEAIKSNEEALQIFAMLGEAGSNVRRKAILKGDEEALRALFTAMDTNSDGMLSWTEWSKYVGARRNVVVSKLFTKLDTDGNGEVNATVFGNAIKSDAVLYKMFDMNGCDAKTVISMMDANGDGKITKTELDQLVKSVAAASPPKKPVKKKVT